MNRGLYTFGFSVFALLPVVGIIASQQPAPKMAEEVYKDIKVFKGVPADDLLPAMQFMSAALKFKCSDCHDKSGDYAAPHAHKDVARNMVEMQRDLNKKYFNGRLEVTCNSCHNGQGHPAGTPVPKNMSGRHQPIPNPPAVLDVIKKHFDAVGVSPEFLVFEGTLTGPNDLTHETETLPVKAQFGTGERFRFTSGQRDIVSDGKRISYYGEVLTGEPHAVFARLGRSWRGQSSLEGLDRVTIAGSNKIEGADVVALRGMRSTSGSTEEFIFDTVSGLLRRVVNVKRSSIGAVVSKIDYQNYQTINGLKVPMRVTMSFADGTDWVLDYKSVTAPKTLDPKTFVIEEDTK